MFMTKEILEIHNTCLHRLICIGLFSNGSGLRDVTDKTKGNFADISGKKIAAHY